MKPPRRKKAEARESVQAQLDGIGLDPIRELADIIRCEVKLSGVDLSDPVLQSLLVDHEIWPGPKGSVLRPRLARRIEALKTLLDFSRPRFRSHRVDGEIDHGITVVLKRFEDPPQREEIAVGPRRDGLPAPIVDTAWETIPRNSGAPAEGG